MRWVITSIAFLTVCGWSAANVQPKEFTAKSQKETIKTQNIVDTINKGEIEAEVEGGGLSAVKLTIRKKTSENIKIIIPSGTFFVNRGKSQNMIATENTNLDLSYRKELTCNITVACANVDRHVPNRNSRFDIKISPPSKDLQKLVGIIEKKKTSQVITQVAIWIVTDNISRSKLDSRYGSSLTGPGYSFPSGHAHTDEDVIKAMQLVEEAGIEIGRKAISKESAIRALSSKDESVLEYASRMLKINIEDRIELLKREIKNREWTVRCSAAGVMGKIKDDQVFDILIDALKFEAAKTKSYMLYNGPAESLKGTKFETLPTQENKEHEQVVLAIAKALGERKDWRAIEPLLDTWPKVSSSYNYLIGKALGQITGKHFGMSYAKWCSWWQQNKHTFTESTLIGIDLATWPTLKVASGMLAEKAGIKNGDVVLKVNGDSISHIKSSSDALNLLFGKAGGKVALTVKRGERTLTFEIERWIMLPPRISQVVGDNCS